MRALIAGCLAGITSAIALAQRSPSSVTPVGVITGDVVESVTRRGLDSASLSIACVGHRSSAFSDSEGRFAFVGIPIPNTCHFAAWKPGYSEGAYGGGRQGVGGALRVDTAWTRDVRVILSRPGAVSGTLLDEAGRPVVGGIVRVLREFRWEGATNWAPGQFARSDDRGVFRVFGLRPGQYVLLASGKGLVAPPANSERRTYRSVFYPSTGEIEDAHVFDLRAQDEVQVGQVVLPSARALDVRGRVVRDRCPSLKAERLVVSARPAGDTVPGAGALTFREHVREDGAFEFEDLPEGRYSFEIGAPGVEFVATEMPGVGSPLALPDSMTGARGGGWETLSAGIRIQYQSTAEAPACFARTSVELRAGQPNAVTLHLTAGGSIRGRVRSLGTLKWPLETGNYLSVSTASSGTEADVTPTGEFELVGLPPGEQWLRLRILGSPTIAVRGMSWNGRDVPDFRIVLAPGEQVSGVMIELTDEIPRIRGSVVVSGGRLPDRTAVLLFPVNDGAWDDLTQVSWITVDRGGRFDFSRSQSGRPLRPGEYYAVALREEELGSWDDPGFLRFASRSARRIRASWGQTAVVDLTFDP